MTNEQPGTIVPRVLRLLRVTTVVLVMAVLLAALSPAMLNLLNGSTVYSGIVVDSRTGKPLSDAKIRGQYMMYKYFIPGPDGLYAVTYPCTTVHADKDGRFQIELKGTARYILVTAGDYYTPFECRLEQTPGNREVVVRLAPW